MKEATEKTVLTKDKTGFLLVLLSTFLMIANVVAVFARLRSNDFKVPVQYIVNDGSVLQTSHWYTLVSFVVFAIAGFIAVYFLSQRLFKSSRGFALGTLITYIVVQLITFLTINALLGLVGRV